MNLKKLLEIQSEIKEEIIFLESIFDEIEKITASPEKYQYKDLSKYLQELIKD